LPFFSVFYLPYATSNVNLFFWLIVRLLRSLSTVFLLGTMLGRVSLACGLSDISLPVGNFILSEKYILLFHIHSSCSLFECFLIFGTTCINNGLLVCFWVRFWILRWHLLPLCGTYSVEHIFCSVMFSFVGCTVYIV